MLIGPVGGGHDLHLTTLVLERLARHRLEQHPELLFGDRAALGPVDAEQLELFRPVAERHHVGHASVAQDVEDGHVFGEADRVVERHQRGRDRDGQVLGARRHRRREQQGRRDVAVGRRVVLGDDGGDAATVFGPRRHLDRRVVEPGHGGDALGRPHVEPHREHARTLDERALPYSGS